MNNLVLEMEQAGAILRNINQPRIKKLLTIYGYGAVRFEEGQALLNQLEILQQLKKHEYQSKAELARSLRADEQEMHRLFTEHRALAKWVYRNDPNGYERLELNQTVASRKAARTVQIQHFYREALKTPQALLRHGLTKAELEQAQVMIESIVEARHLRQQKTVEAQHATQQRDEVRRALRTWMADFRAIARIALRTEPQLLDVLGMVTTT